MSAPNFSAWLPRSHDSVSMNSNWFVCWNFGRKSGEPDAAEARAAEVAVDGDAGEAAGDDRIGHRSRNRRRRPAAAGRTPAAPRPTSTATTRSGTRSPSPSRGSRVQPPTTRVGLDRLVAERRGAGAVDDAAEGARDLARCGSSRCSGRRRCRWSRGFQSHRVSRRSELSIRSGVRKKLFAPGWFGSGTSADDRRRERIDAARRNRGCWRTAGR